MWEPVCRLTQCGHRQRAWYRSWGSRFKSLSNLWGRHSSDPGGRLAGRTDGTGQGRGGPRSGEARGRKCGEVGLAFCPSSCLYLLSDFKQFTPPRGLFSPMGSEGQGRRGRVLASCGGRGR